MVMVDNIVMEFTKVDNIAKEFTKVNFSIAGNT
jgi:hypothetical protein